MHSSSRRHARLSRERSWGTGPVFAVLTLGLLGVASPSGFPVGNAGGELRCQGLAPGQDTVTATWLTLLACQGLLWTGLAGQLHRSVPLLQSCTFSGPVLSFPSFARTLKKSVILVSMAISSLIGELYKTHI